jgi:2-polyprenyl-6-methoxyphenol hydroxylase-like FAD-dependent oxidoreductase
MIVIIGAGPAGLAAAMTLGRFDVPCLVVDRLAQPSPAPRATGISVGAMERLRRWGLQDAAESLALEVEMSGLRAPTLTRVADGVAFPVGMLTREQARVVSPCRGLCLAQDVLEPLLEAQVRTLPSVELRRGAVFAGLEQDDQGVTVWLEGGRSVRADYVIGADGPRSAVRLAAEIDVDAAEGLSDSIGAHVRAPLWRLVPDDRRHVIYAITDPAAGGALIPTGADRWVYATERRAGVEATVDSLTALVRGAAGVADLPLRVDRVVELRYGTALARTFRAGRVLLAGDAAHRVTPRGATGLSMAIVGGEALAWRLAWVWRGWAPPTLLDDYERERRPVAAHNIDRSSRPDGSERGADTEWRVDVGSRLPHVWIDDGTSTLDRLTLGRTLFTGPDPSAWAEAAATATGAPIAVRPLPTDAAQALGIAGGGAVLARPDGVPIAMWADAPRASRTGSSPGRLEAHGLRRCSPASRAASTA